MDYLPDGGGGGGRLDIVVIGTRTSDSLLGWQNAGWMTRGGGVMLLERRVITTRMMIVIGLNSLTDEMIMMLFALLVLPLPQF